MLIYLMYIIYVIFDDTVMSRYSYVQRPDTYIFYNSVGFMEVDVIGQQLS